MKLKTYTLYSLCDPCTGETRYIGQTSYPAKRRLQGHLQTARTKIVDRRPVTDWIRKLLSEGKEPFQKVLYQTQCPEDIDCIEIATIRSMRKRKFRLLNLALGGNTTRGVRASAETKAKLSEARRKRTREVSNRVSESLKRHHALNGSAWSGKKLSEEHKQKIRESTKRTYANMTEEQKQVYRDAGVKGGSKGKRGKSQSITISG